jgi:ribosomal protein S18 acetylase RimI-like enzyme
VSAVRIQRLAPDQGPALCGPVLRSVPEWFGIESATAAYIEATRTMPTWAALESEGTSAPALGFLTVRRHYPHAAEIHCIAVRKDSHGRGIGTMLVRAVEEALRQDGVEFLQVKTMGPSKPNREYAMTLRFYKAVGFVEVEEFIGLWGGLPALQLVRRL